MHEVSNKALVKRAVSKRRKAKDPFTRSTTNESQGFKWPEPDGTRSKCSCGRLAPNNGFPGEYYCSRCRRGWWESC